MMFESQINSNKHMLAGTFNTTDQKEELFENVLMANCCDARVQVTLINKNFFPNSGVQHTAPLC